MLIDANDLSDGTAISADLCILGAGAAGVTLAHSLRDTSFSIVLMESGGMKAEDPTQALYDGTYVGNIPSIDAKYLSASRIRMYGGSTNLWGGYCRPLDALDFEARDWIPDSGWPISRSDLDPYYRRASAEIGIRTFDGAPPYLGEPSFQAQFGDGSLAERLYQFQYVNFGAKHLEEFKASRRTSVYLHANAVELVPAPSGNSLDHVALLTLSGKHLTARAKVYVLSTGGIENARLLLAARRVNSNGIGNANDLVGRYFMEHLGMAILGPMFVWKRASLSRYDYHTAGGGADGAVSPTTATSMFIAPSDNVLRERKLLSVTAQLNFSSSVDSAFKELDRSVMRASADIDGETANGSFAAPQEVGISILCENAPNRDSRVTLGQTLDPLGVPRTELDWRIGNQELDSMQALAELLARSVGSRGLGRVRLLPTRDELRHNIGYGYHHMGTTRMSADPKRGVVDVNCGVYGVGNLFVAGSSVFPTSGAANPTYTILALALRLSDHLRARLA
jgi:choline dehydrogenase-like flavoprotein